MAALAPWPRRHDSTSGGAPGVFWVVFGDFRRLDLDGFAYNTGGLPDGLAMRSLAKGDGGFPDFLFGGTWAQVAREDHPSLLDQVRLSSEVRVIEGTVADGSSLSYLRDLIGLCACWLDRGGCAVVDVFAFKWWDVESFGEQLFLPRRPMPYQHVSILQSPQPNGRQTLHTRGMRLFGRPDLLLREVSQPELPHAVDWFNTLIGRLAMGETFVDGQRLDDLPNLLARVHLRGTLDDPTFNNVHLEIVRT